MAFTKLKDFFQNRNTKNDSSRVVPPAAGNLKSSQDTDLEKIILFSKELDLPIIDLSKYKISAEIIKLIPEEISAAYNLIPLAMFGNVLTVAVSDPFDIVAVDSIKAVTKSDIQLVLGIPLQITKAISDYYSTLNLEKSLSAEEGLIDEALKTEAVFAEEGFNINDIAESSKDEKIVGIVNDILVNALKSRASDIHIEPYPGILRIRYRIDGSLQEVKSIIDKKSILAIVARLKIMSKLDITQRRLPQDGRISIRIESKEIDLRISVIPCGCAEKIVMRILEKSNLQLDMEKLGYSADVLEIFKQAVTKPHGMILITGPTGSGKTTTLYAMLNCLNIPEKNLITVEDPVEYQLKGITQIPVRPEIGLSFAGVLRAVLRQSPDVIMVGEIRDLETVDIAVKAALTGHLMLSTLHTNDAASAIVRFMNMRIEPFLIASTVILIAAQRLARKICPECKESYQLSTANLSGLPRDFKEAKVTLYRGKGCIVCNNKGYFGRVAVVETLVMDDNLRQMILDKKPISNIHEYACERGMKTLRRDAMEKCLKGEVSLDEVLRVTPEDRSLA